MESVERILEKMSNVSKSQRRFLVNLLSLIVIFRGKMNYRNLSRYSDFHEKTFSRWFRREFDFVQYNPLLLAESLPPSQVLLGVMDATFLAKSGHKTHGLAHFYNHAHGRAEKGLEVSLLAVCDVANETAYALSARQTPAPIQTVADENTRLDFYLQHLRQDRDALPPQVQYMRGDGFYAKAKDVQGVLEQKRHLISKLRCDANLRHLYQGPQKKRGRPKLYESKVVFDQLERFESLGQVETGLHLYTALVYRVAFKLTIRLLIILDKRNPKKQRRVLLFSTDTALSGNRIYRDYHERFQIKFLFRDAKQFNGFSDCQATSQQALHSHFNASLTALNLTKIQDRQQPQTQQPKVFSMASWKTRALNEHLLERFITKLDLNSDLIKSHAAYAELRNYGAIAA